MSPTDRQLGMLRLFKRVFLFVGTPLLVAGIILVGRTTLFLRSAERTDARVIKVEHRRSSSPRSSSRVYQPTFEFLDVSGTSRIATLNDFSTEFNYPIGRRVAILYLPENPNRLRVDSFLGVWFVSLIVSALGLGACSFGLVTSIAAKNLRKRHEERVRSAATSGAR
jgi:hypothetical protein